MDSPHSSQSEEVPIYNKIANHYMMRRRPAAPSGEAGTSP
ncbi:hypothetical protein B4144_1404 [Bacillus atrophaeus]|nr:hypothetical protein B4144_1404 [Bacillus atrophaeus]